MVHENSRLSVVSPWKKVTHPICLCFYCHHFLTHLFIYWTLFMYCIDFYCTVFMFMSVSEGAATFDLNMVLKMEKMGWTQDK